MKRASLQTPLLATEVLLVLLGALFLQGCEKKEEKAKPKTEEGAPRSTNA